MPRFAANISLMFGEWSFPDRFAAAADAGFAAVECQFPYDHPAEQLAARARRAGVEVVLVNAPPGDVAAGTRGLAGIAGAEDAFDRSIEVAAQYAQALGARHVHVMSGIGDVAAPGVFDRLARNLGRAADRLADAGLTTVVEPINPSDIPAYLIDSFATAEHLLATLDRPQVKLLFDCYHRQRMAGEIIPAIERLMPAIGHIQIAGAPDRHEPDIGEIHYPAVFEAIDRLGYRGWIGCEYRPAAGTVAGLGWLERMGG